MGQKEEELKVAKEVAAKTEAELKDISHKHAQVKTNAAFSFFKLCAVYLLNVWGEMGASGLLAAGGGENAAGVKAPGGDGAVRWGRGDEGASGGQEAGAGGCAARDGGPAGGGGGAQRLPASGEEGHGAAAAGYLKKIHITMFIILL